MLVEVFLDRPEQFPLSARQVDVNSRQSVVGADVKKIMDAFDEDVPYRSRDALRRKEVNANGQGVRGIFGEDVFVGGEFLEKARHFLTAACKDRRRKVRVGAEGLGAFGEETAEEIADARQKHVHHGVDVVGVVEQAPAQDPEPGHKKARECPQVVHLSIAGDGQRLENQSEVLRVERPASERHSSRDYFQNQSQDVEVSGHTV